MAAKKRPPAKDITLTDIVKAIPRKTYERQIGDAMREAIIRFFMNTLEEKGARQVVMKIIIQELRERTEVEARKLLVKKADGNIDRIAKAAALVVKSLAESPLLEAFEQMDADLTKARGRRPRRTNPGTSEPEGAWG